VLPCIHVRARRGALCQVGNGLLLLQQGGEPLQAPIHCCRVNDREEKYYADGEDAYDMRRTFTEGAKAKRGASASSEVKGEEKAGAAAEEPAATGASDKKEQAAAPAAAEGKKESPAAADKKKPGRRR
jgi:hypothetical protein